MPSRQVPLFLKQQKVKNAKSLEERKAAEKELTSLKTVSILTLPFFFIPPMEKYSIKGHCLYCHIQKHI